MHADDSLKSWTGAVLRFAGAPALLGSAVLAASKAFDKITEFQQEAQQTGFHFMGGIQDIARDFAGINVDLEGLKDIVRSEGETLRFMGDTSMAAATAMSGMGKEAHESAKKFGFFGKHASEMLIETMETASLMVLTGASREEIRNDADRVMIQMNKEAANLANLTGRSQREIRAAGMAVKEDDLLMSALQDLGPGGAGGEAWGSMAQIAKGVLGPGWEEGGPILEFVKGELIRQVRGVPTREGMEARGQVQMAVGGFSAYGDLMKVVEMLQKGKLGDGDKRAMADLFKNIAAGAQTAGESAHAIALKDHPLVQTFLAISNDLGARNVINNADFSAELIGDIEKDRIAKEMGAIAQEMKGLLGQAGIQLRSAALDLFGFSEDWLKEGEAGQEKIKKRMEEIKKFLEESVELAHEIGKGIKTTFEWISWAIAGFHGWVKGFAGYFVDIEGEEAGSARAASNLIAGAITAYAVGLAGKWAMGLAVGKLPFKAGAARWAAANATLAAGVAARGFQAALFWTIGLAALPFTALPGIARAASTMGKGIAGYASRAFGAAKNLIGKISPGPAVRFAMRGLATAGKFTGVGTALWGLYGGAMGLMDEEYRSAGLGVVQRMVGGFVQKLIFGTIDFFGNILLAPVNWLFGTDLELSTEGWFKGAYITLMKGVNDIYDACVDWIVEKIKSFFSWGLDMVKKIPVVGKLFEEGGDPAPASAPPDGSGHSPGPFTTTTPPPPKDPVIDAAKKQGADLTGGGTPLFNSAPIIGGPLADLTRAAVNAHLAAKEKESDSIVKSVDALKGALGDVAQAVRDGNAQSQAIKNETKKQTRFMDEAR